MAIAVYPGSFDPVTKGHLDIIKRAARVNEKLIVAVLINSAKRPLFSVEERVAMLEGATVDLRTAGGRPVEIVTFDGLLVDAAREAGAMAVVRGLRNGSDLDYEEQMAGMNAAMAPGLDVVYLASSPAVRHVASSLVRQVASLGGPLDAFVPPHVAERLKARFPR